jgi:quercetin dioxygenase-like cupin family protein
MIRYAVSIAATGLMVGGALALQPAPPPPLPGVTRTDLQRHDLSIKGWETVHARIDIAPGAVAPRHTHPGEEVIYILEGELEYQIGDKPWLKVRAGDVLFIPAGVVHAARNRSSANGAELATYIVETGKPLVVPAT